MRIERLEIEKLTIPLSKPFKIALGTTDSAKPVIVKVIAEDGTEGIGEAPPSKKILGATQEVLETVLLHHFKPIIEGMEIESPFPLIEEIHNSILHYSAAKFALETALLNLWAKRLSVPLYTILGGRRRRDILTSITAGIDTPENMAKEAKELVDKGAKRIKLKLDGNLHLDIDRISAVRSQIGNNIPIRIDANQSYDVRKALALTEAIKDMHIEFIEQPLPKWDIKGMAHLRRRSPIPVMADESLHTPEDAIRLIREEACDYFNIKLAKAGGFTRAMKIAYIAEASGIKCMVGCMVETEIGITAGVYFALSAPNIYWADLDGHLYLKDSPFKPGFETKDGAHTIGG